MPVTIRKETEVSLREPSVPSVKSVPAKSGDRVGELALKLIAANARLNAFAMVTAAALIVLGLWMYSGMRDSLRDMRAASLQSVLDAEVEAFEVWVNDRRAAVSLWAEESEVRRDIEGLLNISRQALAYQIRELGILVGKRARPRV